MANVELTWELPTPTAQQRPIASVRIEARVSGVQEWSEINIVDAPGTSLTVQDLAPGDWEFRGIVVDNAGGESTPVEAAVFVPFDAPSPLVSFTATVV